MTSLDKINKESAQFSQHWRTQVIRTFFALLSGAIVFSTFSPTIFIEYIAVFLFLLPLYLWAFKRPDNLKYRVIIGLLCLSIAVSIYSGLIE